MSAGGDGAARRGGRRRPTMREVAALAGVGLKTVSRVVNGEPGVSADTEQRVRAAIEQLDFRPDVNAAMLRRLSGKTSTIGLVLEDVANPFSSALHRAVEDYARGRGVLVIAGSCDEDAQRERELIGTFRTRRVDGIVVVPAGGDHSYLLSERRHGTAFVFVDRPARFLDADTVASDNVGGATRAVLHLAAAGHRRIAYLGDDLRIATAEQRLRGYREGLLQLSVEYDPAIVHSGVRGVDDAARIATELLESPDPPTAVFSAQNLVTIGVLRALRALDLHRRVALIGFDDILLADQLDPAVSVVAQDVPGLGRAASELLFRRLDGDSSPFEHVVLDVALVPRGSGEIPVAAGDGHAAR